MSDHIKGRATRIVVDLPFPDKDLSPNARVHFQQKGIVAKAHRQVAKILTVERYNPSGFAGALICQRYFHEPDRRCRDIDNMGAMCKAYQDGIFEALGLDDRLIIEVRNRRMEPEKPGKVIFEIFEAEDGV